MNRLYLDCYRCRNVGIEPCLGCQHNAGCTVRSYVDYLDNQTPDKELRDKRIAANIKQRLVERSVDVKRFTLAVRYAYPEQLDALQKLLILL